MTKEEFAQNYANENVANLTSAIMEAYLEGYKQGELKAASTIDIDGVTYYDLGLESGTLWSKPIINNNRSSTRPLTMLPYMEANKLNIPTIEQLNELINFCMIKKRATNILPKSVEIIGVSGQRITIAYDNYLSGGNTIHYIGENIPEGHNYFWIKDSLEGCKALVGVISSSEWMGTDTHFAGYSLPVILVKSKNEI
ncbi:MAG: hypothetical protein MJZ16_00550 [Bacteroidales bacterium]|nr:hypothetical protein [Bacteroidales bacterium]